MRRRKGNLAEVIQTDVVGSMPLKTLAKVLQSKGRRGDTILAHITPKEAKKLKKDGGAGTTNPETGLPEFYGEEDFYGPPVVDTSSFTQEAPPAGFAQEYGPTYSDLGITSGGQTYGPDITYAPSASVTGYQSPNIPLENYTGTALEGSRYDAGYGPVYNYQPYVVTAGGEAYGPAVPAAPALATTPTELASLAAVGKAATDIGEPVTKAADTTGKTEEEKGTLEKLLSGKGALGLGILGAGGLMGYMNQQRAAEQAKNAAAQIQAAYAQAAQSQKELAQPLIGPGYTQLSQALQGSLSPANTQAFQAAQARAAQASARSGGVGAVQTALQEEALRQQLLASQQQQALNLIAPGNAMIQAAINAQLQGTTQSLGTRLQLENAANQAAMNLYASLGTAIGGGLLKG